MRSPQRSAPILVALLAILAGAAPLRAQSVDDAKKAQVAFELYRAEHIPVAPPRQGGGCDERIGRICIWFGGEAERDFPPEGRDIRRERLYLIDDLAAAAANNRSAWVTGQLVHYLVEAGRASQAEAIAAACGLDEAWWCAALRGYALHAQGEFVRAEEAFRQAMDRLPEERRERWIVPRYVLSRDAERDFERADPDEQRRRFDLFWRLSDPLFLVEGNDRLTDHFARWVEATNLEDAENPQMFWEEDLEETLVRYGRIQGWSRTASPASGGGRRGFQLQDSRRVVGHHHPQSRGYLFPEEFLESPSEVPPESWITAPREARTWYAPPYAPEFRGLDTQVGRFRRGDEMLVVGAYRPESDEARRGGAVEAGLFLVPVDAPGRTLEVRGDEAEGVFTLRAPTGRYVSSLEVLDPEAERAWRARQGVRQDRLTPGLAGVSDLLVLEEGAELPGSLDEAIPLVRPGVTISPDERFVVVWEVYGLDLDQSARVTLGFTRGRPGFLTRVGEFLGVLEPEQPVEVTFDDPGPDGVHTEFRSVALELPELEPGEYTLHLRLEIPGREASVTSRPIVVGG